MVGAPRRPLAAARAVIFAQMVDDPSAHPDISPTEKAQEKEQQRLFRIFENLVLSWPEITRLAREGGKPRAQQGGLFAKEEEEADE